MPKSGLKVDKRDPSEAKSGLKAAKSGPREAKSGLRPAQSDLRAAKHSPTNQRQAKESAQESEK